MKIEFTLCILCIVFAGILFLGNLGGPGANSGVGVTGAPFDLGNCGVCHSGGSYGPVSESLTVSELASGNIVSAYTPGVVYELEVAISAGSPAVAYGFQLTVADPGGNYPGGLMPTSGTQITPLAGRDYAEHSAPSASPLFTVEWTAPAAGSGDMTFYFAGNATNLNFSTDGDSPGPGGILVLPEAQSCMFTTVMSGVQGACVATSSTYSQELTLEYASEPSTGLLDVNGQLFPISGSPQTITLTGLTADCNPVDVTASFTDEPTCQITVPGLFTAPPACPVSTGGPVVINDNIAGGAVNDGIINNGEYSGSSIGINGGFGDVIGAASTLSVESDDLGNVVMGLSSGPGDLNDVVVIYIDTSPAGSSSGFSSTSGFNDFADIGRSAISAGGAQLDFPLENRPEYAITIESGFSGLFVLSDGGNNSLGFVSGLNLTPTGAAAGDYEINFTLGDIGLAPGECFDYMLTYINGNNSFRSNEFHGLNNSCTLSAGNIGQNGFIIPDGSFNTFCSEQLLLSVELISFYGKSENKGNRIHWVTETETQSDFFEVLRSGDGANFLTIGRIEANGESLVRKEYEFLDRFVPNGISYYRLKMADLDGTIALSHIIVVERNYFESLSINPNPASNSVILSLPENLSGDVIVRIFDSSGQLVKVFHADTDLNTSYYELDINDFRAGMYFVHAKGLENSQTMKLFVTK